jgi:hypothetical protein
MMHGQKTIKLFVMYVRPSARMEQLGSHWTDFYQILISGDFSKICPENSSFIKIGKE